MSFLYIAPLLILNALWLGLVLLGLPGTWLMILTTAALSWWKPELELASNWTLAAMTVVALIAEVIEFASSAVGAKRAGASRWAAAGAMLGAFAGAIAGTLLIPIPIVGSVVGVCLGAFCGACAVEVLRGEPIDQSVSSGQGAALGRFVGVLAKLAAGGIIWVTAAVACFV